jgi:hypothetical protein
MSKTNTIPDELTSIYTGVFLINPVIDANNPMFAISNYHVTYHYQPGNPRYPEDDICEGDWAGIVHLGLYDDGEILASKVYIVNPTLILSHSTHSLPVTRYQCTRLLENNIDTVVSGIPLHITWDTKGLPPVTTGERLKEHEKLNKNDPKSDYFKYYTPNENLNLYTKESIMIANDLDYDDPDDKVLYHRRIKPIFNHLNSMGIWKTVKSKSKEN